MPQPIITRISSLDWPSEDDAEETVVVQCAGKSYLAYESRLLNRRTFLHSSSYYQSANNNNATVNVDNDDDDDDAAGKKKKEYDLLTLSDRKLKKLSYYQILSRTLPLHASTDDIRKAYHKACLKYHPDKTGRGEDDEVFLLVKAAFDTLSDPIKRRSYDSTVDFDESIPKEGEGYGDDFYAVFGPVFERNLRFASFNDPARQQNEKKDGTSDGGGSSPAKKKGKNKKKKGGGQSSSSSSTSDNNVKSNNTNNTPPPPFGDDTTSISQVHAFYDFWIHFDSWRDFSLKAEKETEHDLESADCRDEKRWMKNEIDRKVKKMKKDEVARVSLLVERASKLFVFVCYYCIVFLHHHSCSCGLCAVCLDMYVRCVLWAYFVLSKSPSDFH